MKIGIILAFFILFQASNLLFWMTCDEAIQNIKEYACARNPNLGEGASGRAFLVRQSHTPYTLRVLKVQEIKDTAKKARALWEKEILDNLHHQNVIALYEAAQTDNFLFELLEYGAMGNLQTYITTKKGISEDRTLILKLFQQIVMGVKHIHTQGRIVHADLKTENIVITETGIPKIIDFDLAVKYGTRNAIRGTPMYMEPDLMFSNERTFLYDELTDVYAIGIILYEMSHFGKFPFKVTSREALNLGTNLGIYRLKEQIDSDIAFLIIGCLRYNRLNRFTIDQLLILIELALSNVSGNIIQASISVSNRENHNMNYFGNIIARFNGRINENQKPRNFNLVDKNPGQQEIVDKNKQPQLERKEIVNPPRLVDHYVARNDKLFNGRFFTILAALIAIILLAYLTILIFCRSRRTGYYYSSDSSHKTNTTRVAVARPVVVNNSSIKNQKVVVIREPVIVKEQDGVSHSYGNRSPNIIRSNNVLTTQTTTTTYTKTVR